MRYKTLFISILVIMAFNCFAQTRKDHATYNKISREYVINDDGSLDYTYKMDLKLLSRRSWNDDFGETFIIYNPEFQTIKVNEGYTQRADGTKVYLPDNAITNSLPFSCTDCERYNGMKEMVISHTALEMNCIIHLDYTIHSEAAFIKEFMENIDFVQYCPVTEYIVTVKTPKNITLKNRMLNLRLAPTTGTEGNKNVFTWRLTNVMQSSNESYMPTDMVYPELILSTFNDMSHAYFAFVNQEAFRDYSLPESSEIIASITKKNNKPYDNIIAIRDYVADAIHLNNFNQKHTDYQASSASKTWHSACGTELDKAILLTAMLRNAGYEAIPVALIKERYHSDEVACLDLISHYAVRTRIDDKDFYLSPTEKNNSSLEYTYGGYMAYFIDSSIDHFIARYLGPVDNKASLKGDIIIKDNGTANEQVGYNITTAGLPYYEIDNNNSILSQYATNTNGEITCRKLDFTNAEFTVNAEEVKMEQIGESGYYTLNLPAASNTFKVNPAYLNEKREHPIRCKKTDETYTYTITMPKGWKSVTNNVHKSYGSSFGKMDIDIKVNGNTITVIRSLKVTQETIEVSQYKDFRAMMNDWTDDAWRKIIVKSIQN